MVTVLIINNLRNRKTVTLLTINGLRMNLLFVSGKGNCPSALCVLAKNFQDMLIVKMLLYTGMRVSELINIKLSDIDLDAFQIKIIEVKGKKDRVVTFSQGFRETLAMTSKSDVFKMDT